MEITSQDFEKVIMFQELESIIREEQNKLKRLNQEIEEVESNFSKENLKLKEIEEEHKQMLIERKKMEGELYQFEQSIKKHQSELNQVKKNEEFKALLIEIEDLKSKKDKYENNIIEIMEKIDKKLEQISGLKEKLSEAEKEKNEFISNKKLEIEKIKIYMDELTLRQKGIKDEIKDEGIKKRIDTLLKTKNGVAIVKINIKRNETLKSNPEEYFCSGCNMKLTSSDVSAVKKFNTFIICQNCSRLVYYRG